MGLLMQVKYTVRPCKMIQDVAPTENYRGLKALFIQFIKSILKSLVAPVIWLAQIGAIYSQIAPFFALNHIIFSANEEVTLQTCGLSWHFRERLCYTVELSSNQK